MRQRLFILLWIFNAFRLTGFSQTKVVIVGQDPYHEEGQAMGLSFSVRENVEEPPSLKNIHEEIMREGVEQGPWSSDLTRWARQGVLLLSPGQQAEGVHAVGKLCQKQETADTQQCASDT